MDDSLLSRLADIVGEDRLLTSPEDLFCYSYDATQMPLRDLPGAVVVPLSTAEVAAVVRLANELGFAVIPRGSGTGLTGGSIPPPDAVVMDLSQMNHILEIDEENMTATVEPGVITDRLQAEVQKKGLFYPPDPASSSISSLGGNVAENAGGLRGLKYGVTEDYVLGLEVVLPTGEVITTGGKCVKDVAGYNLTGLLVGSEGTLGVVTKIFLRLIPQPEAKQTMVAYFHQIDDAARAVSSIIAAKVIPSALEIMDQTTIRYVEKFKNLGLPTDAGAMLLIEVDGPKASIADEASKVSEICRRAGASEVTVARSDEEAMKLREARKGALPALARVRPTIIMEEISVPRGKIATIVKEIEDITGRYNLEVAIFGHAGDGNLHPNYMVDERDEEEIKRMDASLAEIFEATLALGGSMTGEHGIGIKRRHLLPQKAGEAAVATMRSIKKALDPNNILNPGKIFLEEEIPT